MNDTTYRYLLVRVCEFGFEHKKFVVTLDEPLSSADHVRRNLGDCREVQHALNIERKFGTLDYDGWRVYVRRYGERSLALKILPASPED